MTQNSDETNAIRQRMEEVRRDLDQDVQGIVEGTRDMGDWRSYVRSYPWVCAGAAVAAGYLLVPRRRAATQPDAEALAELVTQSCLAATPRPTAVGKVRNVLLTAVGNLVMQEVSSYVRLRAGKLLDPPAASSPQDGQR
jgi:hypothetical protein